MARQLQPSNDMKNNRPTHEEISARAYQIFVANGCREGRDLEHWLQAEAELSGANKEQQQPEIAQAVAASASKPSTKQAPRRRA
jgi:hypothetical protein